MSFVTRRSQSPPPMPSPELVPTPLPSPPPILHRSSRLTVPANNSPPIPPRLIGSPLLQNTLNASRSHDRLNRKAKEGLFGEDDEFGARKRALGKRSNSSISSLPILSTSPTRIARRALGQSSTRYRSPPPSPTIASPPPPVPPIPAFMLTPTDKKSVVQSLPSKRATAPAQHALFDLPPSLSRPRCESTPQTPGAMTCMQFFTMHNTPRRDCRV
ncbi:hypothetical protein DFJ58DRAFT_769437 [Suillus subalutaceus]|uniref:uncharacterized protein n=1 Tax=Suillus subalutaceus TaxID=48586 RepID=UPI001B8602EB|nr:uncharacterized protein DFJ58DRAFT_769437 [Suillus subalutaceus]KAG1866496.1 hypothetical protein DFJ58DRAFT_769437 [Suillus subalutaceus]